MKIGLELHQRLDTHKLFCVCPSILTEDMNPDLLIRRKLHPVFSELGEIDQASQAEYLKDKTFVYQAWSVSNCLVETDEEPPHDINPEALNIVLEIAMQLKATPIDEVHVMRKIVIDGSNTGGFQRTAVVAIDGKLETSQGTIGIPLIALEEESSGIVKKEDQEVTYRLDRLGIPLIEISTTPDIKDGKHLREVAEKIGMIFRATGKVARGLGTIRQDVNVSIEEGARVEIKGAQDLKLLPTFLENEVKRQENLLTIIKQVKKLFNGNPKFSRSFFDVSGVFKDTKSSFILKALKRGESVYAAVLPKHAGLLGKEIQFNRRYGSELSDYAKHAGVKGLIHSDEALSKYGISEKEVSELSALLEIKKQDAFIVVIAQVEIAKKALSLALDRAEIMRVIEETRRANPDGSTSYMRPLPGRARMYPETDVMPVCITEAHLNQVKKSSGGSLEEKKKKLSQQLNQEMADRLIRSKHLKLYEKLVIMGVEPMVVASTLENTLVSLRREGAEIKNPEKILPELFEEYLKGSFTKAAIPDILKWWISMQKPVDQIVKEKKLFKITGTELKKIVKENNYDMKKIMALYRFRVDPAEVQKLMKKK